MLIPRPYKTIYGGFYRHQVHVRAAGQASPAVGTRFPAPPRQTVRPAGQASSGDISPWAVIGIVAVGFVAYEALKYGLKKYAR